MNALPVNEFIFKIASRCNLDCDYCYEYRLGDNSWKTQPATMSMETVGLAARRIAEHARVHQLERVNIAFHGGEPMLVGPERLSRIAQTLRDTIRPEAVTDFTMQSNATLMSENMATVLRQHRIAVGVSIDGPKRVNDLHRNTHTGASSFEQVLQGIVMLREAGVLSGLLSVIDVTSDPLEVIDFIATLQVAHVDFLFPHYNWVRPPPRPHNDEVAYGRWYATIWHSWVRGRHSWMRIRFLEQLVRMLAGAPGLFEVLGLTPAQLLVVAADGSLEGVDTLKSAAPGSQLLQIRLKDSNLDDVLAHPSYRARQGGAASLCEKCQQCEWLSACGGGYIPHRYAGNGSFIAPSVYCQDLSYLFEVVSEDLKVLKEKKGAA